MHDLLITGARIIDGTDSPSYHADLAVRDGRIAAIGRDLGPARETVDAAGLVLAPGIIDTHTHYDAQVTWDPHVTPSPALGVTTAIMGNCGFTLAPCRPEDRDLTLRNLTQVEGMSLDALRQGVQWGFESFPEYLDFLEKRGVGPNVAAFVGHSSLRTWALRDDAATRAATPEEVARMREQVVEAMQVGAIGFSTSTSRQHNGEGGVPMPSRLADDTELETLCGALRESGRGVLMITKDSAEDVSRMERWSAAAGRPFVVCALFHSTVTPDSVFNELEGCRAAQSRGNDLRGGVSPCPLTMEFSLHSPYVFEGLASWKPAARIVSDPVAYRAMLADPAFRDALHEDLARRERRMFNGQWDQVVVRAVRDAKHAHFEGMTVAAAAAREGKRPFDWLLDLGLSEDLDTVFIATLLNSDEAALSRILTDPVSLITLSDAGAHLEFFCDAGFALHVLGHWVRDRELMSLERAIHRMTGEPADLFGIPGRGRLVAGAHADLFLFDPDTVGRGPAQRVHDLPAGASRLVTPAIGVHGVWVNGVKIADGNGLVPDAPMPGRVLREFHA